MKEYDLASLAQASDKDLVEFLGQNDKVLAEVTTHIANLERLRGTSQAHALGYQEYLPDEITMQDFDTHLSKKGYQMSTEALHTVLLVAASAAVVAGIGLIAYKLIKASMAKPPKSADFLKKEKEVQQFAFHLLKVEWGGASPEARNMLKERFLADSVSEVIVDMSEADILNNTFDAYMRSQLRTDGVPYMSLVAGMRGPGSLFAPAALIYLTNIKESMEAFRREFLDVISGAPDITDHQMINLVNGLKWNQIDTLNPAGVQAILGWVNAMALPTSNKLEENLRTGLDLLSATATVDQIKAYDQGIVREDPADAFAKLFAMLASLKATGKYIEGSKSNFTAGEKRSQQVVGLYKAQIDRAMLLVDSIALIEELARLESDSIVRRSKAIANAGKRLLNAVEDVADKLQDKDEAKKLREALDEVAKASRPLLKMKTESLVDNFPARVSFGSMMDLQAKNVWMDILKSLAVVALIGLAAFALQAVVLSMLGLQSMAASFAGGVVYFNKNGKRITPGEAADAIAQSAESKSLGKYGCYMLAKNHSLPFKLTPQHLDSGFNQCSSGIKRALTEFAGALPRGNTLTGEELIKAVDTGSKYLWRTIPILEGRLKDMGVKLPAGDPSVKATTHKLREVIDAYNEEWFTKEKADYQLIRKGIDTTWFGQLDEKAGEHVDRAATEMTDGIIAFGKNIPNASKEQLQAMSQEAQEAHAGFNQTLAYLSTLAFAIGEITKKAVGDGGRAMQVVKDNLKMRGEGVDGIEVDDDFGGDNIVQYQEDMDPLVDIADAMDELYVDEQADVIMATENRKVMIGRLLMTAGIVIILGAGAYLLITMSQNRRKESSFATQKMFDNIANDLHAGLASEEFAAQMQANAEDFGDALQKDFAKIREQVEKQRKQHAASAEKDVNGQRVDAGAAQSASVHPRIGETGSPVVGSNSAASVNPETTNIDGVIHSNEMLRISKDVDTLIANLGKFDYRGKLRALLVERSPGMVALNLACGTFDKASESMLRDREHRVTDLMKLTVHIMENIVDPVFDVVKSTSNHEALAEKAYDGVVDAIGHAVAEADKLRLTDEGFMARSQEDVDSFNKPCTETDVAEAIQRFDQSCVKSAERFYLSEQKAYNNMSSDLDTMIGENSAFLNKDVGDRFNELKGNRDKTSKLLRRLEEFKPLFNVIARGIKTHVALSDAIFQGAEFTLRVHRSIQRDLIKSLEFEQLKVEELNARVGKQSESLQKLSRDMQGQIDKFKGTGKGE